MNNVQFNFNYKFASLFEKMSDVPKTEEEVINSKNSITQELVQRNLPSPFTHKDFNFPQNNEESPIVKKRAIRLEESPAKKKQKIKNINSINNISNEEKLLLPQKLKDLGKEIDLIIDNKSTVKDFKSYLATENKISQENIQNIRLIFNGKEMHDDETLIRFEKYNLPEVHIIIKKDK